MFKRFLYFLLVSVFIFVFTACGVKKFPSIPFFKSAPEIKNVNYKIKNGKLILSWKKIKDNSVKLYNLYRLSVPEGVKYCLKCDRNYRKIASFEPEEFGDNGISITIEDLKNEYKYCYAVSVETKSGSESNLSNKVCVDWFYKDNIISNIKVQPEDRSLKISWQTTNYKDIDLQSVNIYKKDSEGKFKLIVSEPNKNFTIIKDLTNDKRYTFYIAPSYKYGNNVIEGKYVKVVGIPEDLTPPALPNFFTGYFTKEGIFLKWAKSTSDDVLGYDIIRKAEGESIYTQININLIKKESFLDRTVEKGKVYYYKIRAIDNNFNASEFSNPIKIIAE